MTLRLRARSRGETRTVSDETTSAQDTRFFSARKILGYDFLNLSPGRLATEIDRCEMHRKYRHNLVSQEICSQVPEWLRDAVTEWL